MKYCTLMSKLNFLARCRAGTEEDEPQRLNESPVRIPILVPIETSCVILAEAREEAGEWHVDPGNPASFADALVYELSGLTEEETGIVGNGDTELTGLWSPIKS